MDLIRQFVNKKCKELNQVGLLGLANRWNVTLSKEDSETVLRVLHAKDFDLFTEPSRLKLQQVFMRILGSRFKW
jgi:hypothetical protein